MLILPNDPLKKNGDNGARKIKNNVNVEAERIKINVF